MVKNRQIWSHCIRYTFAHIIHARYLITSQKQEEVTARNRVLASAMFNVNASQLTGPLTQKFTPATKYSPPTCHTALQAVKNKQQFKQPEQSNRNVTAKFEIGSGPVRPPEPQTPSYLNSNRFMTNQSPNFVNQSSQQICKSFNNNNNNDEEDGSRDESARKLARTWSVGKLVNNFETSPPPQAQQDNPPAQSNSVRDLHAPTKLYHKFSAPSLPSGFHLPTNSPSAKPFLAPKPPSLMGGTKTLLRHTVRPYFNRRH